MKRLWTGLIVAVLTGAMCLSFAACDRNSADDTPDEDVVDGNADLADRAAAFAGKEIAEEQWYEAVYETLIKEDIEYTMEVETTYTSVDERTATDPETMQELSGSREYIRVAKQRSVVKGGKAYMKTAVSESVKYSGDYEKIAKLNGSNEEELQEGTKETVTDQYAEKTDEGWFKYTLQDGVWKKSSGRLVIVGPQSSDDQTRAQIIRIAQNSIYDAKQKGYVY